MSKPEVLMTGALPDWCRARIERRFAVYGPADLDSARADRIDVIIAAGAVEGALINRLPKLRLIANFGAGYEKIDLEIARARGIAITNTPGVTDGCVADMAFALLLALTRDIVSGDQFVRQGSWLRVAYPLARRVHGRRMGILGLGRIGLAIARRAEAFDMPVAYHNRRPRDDVRYPYHDTAAGLAADSDILVVACPGGEGTRGLVDAAVLKALGPRGVIVNIARGSIIDEAALVTALTDGTIAGAALDVFDQEPKVPPELIAMKNVVLMPHRGGGTDETWEDGLDLVSANVEAFLAGRPLLTPVDA